MLVEIFSRFALFMIKIGRTLAKNLQLENNPIVLKMHSQILKFAVPQKSGSAQVRLIDYNFVLDRDLSMLPGLINDTYEVFERRYVSSMLKQGEIFLDVGANFGLYSVLASKIVGLSGKVISFEPVPRTFSYLQKNCAPFAQANIFNVAVGENEGVLDIHFDPLRPGCSTGIGSSGEVVSVQVVSLDRFLQSIGISKVDFIKIDVEGLEMEVLKGCLSCLKESTKILCEFNPSFLRASGRDPEEFLKFVIDRFSRISFIKDLNGSIFEVKDLKSFKGQLIANLILEFPKISIDR